MSTPDPTPSPLDTLTKYVAANAGKPQDDRYWAGWMAMVAEVQAEIRARPTPDDGYCSTCGCPFTDNIRSALGLPSSTPLDQRLVMAVRTARQSRPGDFDWGQHISPRAAVVAVLRELDTEVMHRVMNNLEPVDLIGVADSIEKGGEDA
jgi:hypothetical protein